jgi:hypothetical protein
MPAVLPTAYIKAAALCARTQGREGVGSRGAYRQLGALGTVQLRTRGKGKKQEARRRGVRGVVCCGVWCRAGGGLGDGREAQARGVETAT